jgi:hypothetical protein
LIRLSISVFVSGADTVSSNVSVSSVFIALNMLCSGSSAIFCTSIGSGAIFCTSISGIDSAVFSFVLFFFSITSGVFASPALAAFACVIWLKTF